MFKAGLMEGRAHPFKGRLGLPQVFAAGFSLGGCTVVSSVIAITDTRNFVAWVARQPTAAPGPLRVPRPQQLLEPLLERSRVFRASWERQSRPHGDARAPAPPVRGLATEGLKAVTRPVAILVGGAEAEAPPQECAGWLDEQLPNSRLVFLGPEVGHGVFLCESTDLSRRADPVACVDPPGVDRRLVHDKVAALTAWLFRT